jgi:flagellar biosynthesis/type III secretory pathway chaperone
MSARIDHLIDCLNGQRDLLEKLVLLLDEEKTLIVDLDASGVEAKCESKLHLIELLEGNKCSCKAALEEAARELHLPESSTLSAVIAASAQPGRAKLEKVQQVIFHLVDALKRINRFNRELLYGSLGTINRSLEFYRNSFGAVNTYSGEGRMLSGVAAGRLVHGEI